jgi:hypothetical protein
MTGRRIYLKGADSTDYVITGQLDDGGIEFDRDPDDLFDSGHMSHVDEWWQIELAINGVWAEILDLMPKRGLDWRRPNMKDRAARRRAGYTRTGRR